MDKWLILIKERFHPLSYFPMIAVFTVVNSFYGYHFFGLPIEVAKIFLIFSAMALFFLRMRFFDELKDYEVDLKHNPKRPLPRGVLSVRQVKSACFYLMILELAIVAPFGFWPLVLYASAMGYSLLMYEEFFIGDFLRPKLTTYAVSHTFVSAILGFSCATLALSSSGSFDFSREFGAFFLMNWCFFNLFEFARKTFAPVEERDEVASYSKIFGVFGAWLLSVSQVVLGAGIATYYFSTPWIFVLAGAYVLFTLLFVFESNPQRAKLFRGISAVYLLAHYILLAAIIGGQ